MKVNNKNNKIIILIIARVVIIFISISDLVLAGKQVNIYVGPFEVIPTLEINFQRDDNILKATHGDEMAATLMLIKSAVFALAEDGVVDYAFKYQLESARYWNSNQYIDHKMTAKIDWQFDNRHLLELGTFIDADHEELSINNLAQFSTTVLNDFMTRGVSAKYTFGSESSRGRISAGVNKKKLRHTMSKSINSLSDVDTNTINFDISLGASSHSKIILQWFDVENFFKNNPIKNRKSQSYLIGAKWNFTDSIKSNIRWGNTKNNLVNASLPIWMASLVWYLQEHNALILRTNKRTQNSENNVGSFVDVTDNILSWSHKWDDRFTATVFIGQRKNNFIGVGREDTVDSREVVFKFIQRRWINLGLSITKVEADSTVVLKNYVKNSITFFISANL